MTWLAAKSNFYVNKTDTKQAFLNVGEIGDEVTFVRPPDLWPEPVLKGCALQLLVIV